MVVGLHKSTGSNLQDYTDSHDKEDIKFVSNRKLDLTFDYKIGYDKRDHDNMLGSALALWIQVNCLHLCDSRSVYGLENIISASEQPEKP